MTLALRFAARSHTGLLRDGNEDSVYAGPRVLAVADGMGGHAAGEVASAVAIAALAPLDEDAPSSDLLDVLRDSALAANDHLRDMVAGDPTLDGMGTTLTAFLFAGPRLGMLHIGDSRAYLLRDGVLSQITHDDTLVQTLVDEGRISEEEASTHPQRSLITRALDGRDGVDFDLSVREARDGDRYLLCTDGLTGPVGRLETLQEALGIADPQESCDRLVQLALRGGGPDNVTVIVADVVDASGLRAGPPVIAGAAAESPQQPPDGIAESSAARARTAEGRDVPPPPRNATAPAVSGSRRNRRRTAVVSMLVLALVAGGAGSAYAYVRSQYFVGEDAGRVAVFRGVTGTVAGVALHSVDRRTELEVARLDVLAQRQVERGIVAEDEADASAIVDRLHAQVPCPAPAPSSSPSAQPSGSPSAEAAALPPPSSAELSPSPTPSPPVGTGAAPSVALGCPSSR